MRTARCRGFDEGSRDALSECSGQGCREGEDCGEVFPRSPRAGVVAEPGVVRDIQSWAFQQAHEKSLAPVTTSCATAVNWYKSQGRFSYYLAIGALAFFGPGGGEQVGLVYKYDDDNAYTIQGNTNGNGSTEGNPVDDLGLVQDVLEKVIPRPGSGSRPASGGGSSLPAARLCPGARPAPATTAGWPPTSHPSCPTDTGAPDRVDRPRCRARGRGNRTTHRAS
ncbi:hypothetical protein GCM10010211_47430 [Streptomyces albospinus]|uniref:Uncharacterized protein n=1 Tax=Streptomyces albospinus TaxID=285515 RepID=A0ABQ2VCH7_9ACTN|nr:hypothetical protein GCM10010211_47430 [Streptomyces albospinus]